MATDVPSVDAIFFAALDKASATERAAYLDEVCGQDTSLRRRVERLLGAQSKVSDFLESPAAGAAAAAPISEGPGTVIGPYKLLEQIGEGGFAVVFKAEQSQPVRRKVALKILKLGMDTRQVVARFEAERQALAIMDHPNIATVYDGGVTASGRPFFVMELVKGVPLTDYCDENQLTLVKRLELFIPVCQAVQHAHQKGIIHRDVKPSNVLVTMHDGKPAIKVIDFGVAKALGHDLTDKTLFTGFAQMIGTPLYMSPEQAGQSGLDVDTRSDIYSLGVLLYELLTGTTPFERERFRSAAYDEIRRIIHEEDPPKPSTRLSELGRSGALSRSRNSSEHTPFAPAASTLASVAAQRRIEPAKLTRLVRGELDWIVMKALEKDRNRRYETAVGLARDIDHYLRNEPVQACPPTAGYQLRKFVRKHRAALATVSAFALLLIIATAVSIGFAARAIRAESHSRTLLHEITGEQQETKAALDREAVARRRTRRALARISDRVIEDTFTRKVQLTTGDENFLRQILEEYQSLADETGDGVQALELQAEGLYRVGRIRHRLGESENAESDQRAALGIRARLAAEFPNVAAFRNALAESHVSLGTLLRDANRPADALAEHDAAVAIRTSLVVENPDVPEYRQELARSYINSAVLLHDLERHQDAEVALGAARDALTRLIAEFPGVAEYRRLLGAVHHSLGLVLRDTGRVNEAEASYKSAIEIRTRLTDEYPATAEFRETFATSHYNLGLLLWTANRQEDASRHLRSAVEILTQLSTDYPTVPNFRVELARSQVSWGKLMRDVDRPKEAESALRDALRVYTGLATQFPAKPDNPQNVASTHSELGVLLRSKGHFKEAEEEFRSALAICGKLVTEFGADPEYSFQLAANHNDLGLVLARNRPEDAEDSYHAALEIQKRLVTDHPTVSAYRKQMGITYNNLGTLLRATGRLDDAEAASNAALELDRKLVAEHPDQAELRNELAGALVNLAELRRARKDFTGAQRLLDEARPHHLAALHAFPTNRKYREFWRNNRGTLCNVWFGLRNHENLAKVAGELAHNGFDPATDAFLAAGYLARCVLLVQADAGIADDERAERVRQYADQAMSLLRHAVERGFKNAAQLRRDSGLATLRTREDFQKLIEQLEVQTKK